VSNVQEVKTRHAPILSLPLSQGIRAGDFLFVSGQTARNANGEWITDNFEAEVRCVLENVRAIVEAAGGSMDRICKVGAYLTDLSLFDEFNRIYVQYFQKSPPPARTTVGCSLARRDLHVEIDAVVWLGS
jgi:2-iminobutanoate/2-iminopropanoate deaminase